MSVQNQTDILFLQPPSPPFRDVLRDFAGGFGVALPSSRAEFGHGEVTQPYMSTVYAAASAANAGMTVTYLDAQAENMDLKALWQRVKNVQPKVVVSVLSLPSLRVDLQILENIKRLVECSVVGVGTVCRTPETLPEIVRSDGIDYAVNGDPEMVILPTLERLLAGRSADDLPGLAYASSDGVVHRNEGGKLVDLDVLPVPHHSMLPMNHYRSWEFGRAVRVGSREFGHFPKVFPLYLSRGCPYGCDYCPYPLGFGNRWRRKSVEQVMDELHAITGAGVNHFYLRDQTVGEDLDFLAEVCEAIVRDKSGVQWLCETRPGSLDASMLRLMRQAGCVRIHYGVETGDTRTFVSQAKRGIDPGAIAPCLDQTRAAGILPSLHFLIGFPDDDWGSVSATLDLIRACQVSAGDCALMTPYPGTRQYQTVLREGRLLARSWDDFTGADPIVHIDGLSPVELVLARWRVLTAVTDMNQPRLRRRLAKVVLAGQEASVEIASLIDSSIRAASAIPTASNSDGAIREA